MIEFARIQLSQREEYEKILFNCEPRGCEYTFANLYLWGKQQVAFLHGCVAFFSHFYGRTVYPYPSGMEIKRRSLKLFCRTHQSGAFPAALPV